MAPLLQLKRAAQKAEELARYARAVELYERALAAAELAQPRNSLIIAALLDELRTTHVLGLDDVLGLDAHSCSSAAAGQAEFIQRLLPLLHTRWQAGTLFAPTAEETAYLVENEYPWLPAQMCGAYFYIIAATVALRLQGLWPPCTPAEGEVYLQGVYGALRAALETDTRGMLERHPRTGQAWPASSAARPSAGSAVKVFHLKALVHRLVTRALSDEAGLLLRMRATCGLTPAEEKTLRQLAERCKAEYERNEQERPKTMESINAKHQQAAAADAARYGLRRCALPSCDAQEPHPKLFKLCGRCRGVAYCCAAHSVEDWKRHKREDGCAAAP